MAVKSSGAPAPQLFTPKADSQEGEKVNQDYAGAKQTFQEKVNSPKSEQALKKDTGMGKNEHLAKLQNDHVNAINKLNQAEASKKDAQAQAQADPYAAEIAGDPASGKPAGSEDNLIKNITQNFGGGKLPGMGGLNGMQNLSAIQKPEGKNNLSMIGGPNAGFQRRGGTGMAVGNSDDPGALMGMLGQKRAEAGDMRGQMEGLGLQQDGLMGLGQKQAGMAQRFGGLKNAFGNQAVMHGDLQKAYGEAGKGLKSASKGLGNAAQVLKGVSAALKSAAAAVAAIPFVGPALSAALKTASTIVGVVGQCLGMASKKTGQSGDKMNAKSADEGQLKDVNNAKKVANEAKETQAKDDVKRTQKQVDGVTGAKNEAQNELKSNVSEQRDLAKKIEEKGGGKAAIDTQDDNAVERPQIQLDKDNKNQKKAGNGTPAGGSSQPTPAGTPAQPAQAQPAAGAPKTGGVAPVGGPAQTAAPQAAAPQPAAPQAAAPQGAAPQAAAPQAEAPHSVQPASGASKSQANNSQVQATGQNGKGKKEDKDAEAREAAQSPVNQGKKPLGARPLQKKQQPQGHAKPSNQGQEVTGGGDAKRKKYEAELAQLADKVNASKSGGDQAHQRRDAQRQLANVYKDAAANNVAVSSEIEKKASNALKDSPERLGVRLRTVEEMGEGQEGQNGNGFGQKKPFKLGDKNNLQRAGLQIPKLAAPNFLAMQNGLGAQDATTAKGAEVVQPVQKMAS